VPGVHSRWSCCSEELPARSFPKDFAVWHRATFGPGLPRPGLVPPLPFFPTSTVCSTWHFAGLLRPAADPGVRHVSGLRSRCARVPPACRSRGGSGVGQLSCPAVKAGPSSILLPARRGAHRSRGIGSRPLRGLRPFLLDLSQWRSTLRSLSLVSSCAASIERFSRTSDGLPRPGEPDRGVMSEA
jgi:hypothetical protein